MTITEDLLSKREVTIFIGVENHSTPYNPLLFKKIWAIPDSLPSKDLLIIPINGLEKPYMVSPKRIMCYGKSLWVLFVDSPFFSHNAFLFESFPQTDENNYFTDDRIQFLQKINCSSVAVCDIGVYKSRSLVKLLNHAIVSFGKYNITVCLVTILGHNSRGFTDIEAGDEKTIYLKEYYLHSDIEGTAMNESFYFIQIEKKFQLSDLFMICCQTKSQVESKLQEIKEQAKSYIDPLKPLWKSGALKIIIESFNKGDSFDFVSLENNLKKMGFRGNLIDAQWNSIYEKLCQNIRESNKENRNSHVKKLIDTIGRNIDFTIKFLEKI